MQIDFSCNRGKSLHMYNLFFLKLSENILSYKNPPQKNNNNNNNITNTKNTQKGHRKKLVMSTFYFLLFLMGCKNPYFTYKP